MGETYISGFSLDGTDLYVSHALKPAFLNTPRGQISPTNIDCTGSGVATLKKAIDRYPDFPFSYVYLAGCYRENHSADWQVYAQEAVRILEIQLKLSAITGITIEYTSWYRNGFEMMQVNPNERVVQRWESPGVKREVKSDQRADHNTTTAGVSVILGEENRRLQTLANGKTRLPVGAMIGQIVGTTRTTGRFPRIRLELTEREEHASARVVTDACGNGCSVYRERPCTHTQVHDRWTLPNAAIRASRCGVGR